MIEIIDSPVYKSPPITILSDDESSFGQPIMPRSEKSPRIIQVPPDDVSTPKPRQQHKRRGTLLADMNRLPQGLYRNSPNSVKTKRGNLLENTRSPAGKRRKLDYRVRNARQQQNAYAFSQCEMIIAVPRDADEAKSNCGKENTPRHQGLHTELQQCATERPEPISVSTTQQDPRDDEAQELISAQPIDGGYIDTSVLEANYGDAVFGQPREDTENVIVVPLSAASMATTQGELVDDIEYAEQGPNAETRELASVDTTLKELRYEDMVPEQGASSVINEELDARKRRKSVPFQKAQPREDQIPSAMLHDHRTCSMMDDIFASEEKCVHSGCLTKDRKSGRKKAARKSESNAAGVKERCERHQGSHLATKISPLIHVDALSKRAEISSTPQFGLYDIEVQAATSVEDDNALKQQQAFVQENVPPDKSRRSDASASSSSKRVVIDDTRAGGDVPAAVSNRTKKDGVTRKSMESKKGDKRRRSADAKDESTITSAIMPNPTIIVVPPEPHVHEMEQAVEQTASASSSDTRFSETMRLNGNARDAKQCREPAEREDTDSNRVMARQIVSKTKRRKSVVSIGEQLSAERVEGSQQRQTTTACIQEVPTDEKAKTAQKLEVLQRKCIDILTQSDDARSERSLKEDELDALLPIPKDLDVDASSRDVFSASHLIVQQLLLKESTHASVDGRDAAALEPAWPSNERRETSMSSDDAAGVSDTINAACAISAEKLKTTIPRPLVKGNAAKMLKALVRAPLVSRSTSRVTPFVNPKKASERKRESVVSARSSSSTSVPKFSTDTINVQQVCPDASTNVQTTTSSVQPATVQMLYDHEEALKSATDPLSGESIESTRIANDKNREQTTFPVQVLTEPVASSSSESLLNVAVATLGQIPNKTTAISLPSTGATFPHGHAQNLQQPNSMIPVASASTSPSFSSVIGKVLLVDVNCAQQVTSVIQSNGPKAAGADSCNVQVNSMIQAAHLPSVTSVSTPDPKSIHADACNLQQTSSRIQVITEPIATLPPDAASELPPADARYSKQGSLMTHAPCATTHTSFFAKGNTALNVDAQRLRQASLINQINSAPTTVVMPFSAASGEAACEDMRNMQQTTLTASAGNAPNASSFAALGKAMHADVQNILQANSTIQTSNVPSTSSSFTATGKTLRVNVENVVPASCTVQPVNVENVLSSSSTVQAGSAPTIAPLSTATCKHVPTHNLQQVSSVVNVSSTSRTTASDFVTCKMLYDEAQRVEQENSGIQVVDPPTTVPLSTAKGAPLHVDAQKYTRQRNSMFELQKVRTNATTLPSNSTDIRHNTHATKSLPSSSFFPPNAHLSCASLAVDANPQYARNSMNELAQKTASEPVTMMPSAVWEQSALHDSANQPKGKLPEKSFSTVIGQALNVGARNFEQENLAPEISHTLTTPSTTRALALHADAKSPPQESRALHAADGSTAAPFSAASGNTLQIDTKRQHKANQAFQLTEKPKSVSFSTASGKRLQVDAQRLLQATSFLHLPQEPALSSSSTAKGKEKQVGSSGLQGANLGVQATKESATTSFSTALGKTLQIDAKRLQQATLLVNVPEEPSMSSFSIAKGNAMQVEPKRQQEENLAPQATKEPATTSFSNASGKMLHLDAQRLQHATSLVHVPEKQAMSSFSIQKGKEIQVDSKRLREANPAFQVTKESATTSFSTATGKTLQVDKQRLQHAASLVHVPQEPAMSSFSTAKGTLLQVESKRVQEANLAFQATKESETTSFSTASGKTLQVDVQRLDQATSLVHVPEKQALSSFSTAKGNAMQVNSSRLREANLTFQATKESVTTSFSAASGKTLQADEQRLQHAASLVHVPQEPAMSSFSTAKGNVMEVNSSRLRESNLAFQARKESATTSFSTASGKKLEIDAQRLDLATSLVHAPQEQAMSSFSTAKGNAMQVDFERLQKANLAFQEIKESAATSFSTASGKRMQVDARRLQQANSLVHVPQEPSMSSFSTAKGKVMQVVADRLQEANLAFQVTEEPAAISFSTAPGNRVQVDAQRLQHATSLIHVAEEKAVTSFSTAKGSAIQVDSRRLLDANLASQVTEDPMSTSFSTAAGKTLQIDAKRLQQATSLVHVPKEQTMTSFSTAGGKSLQVDVGRLRKATLLVDASEDAATAPFSIGNENIARVCTTRLQQVAEESAIPLLASAAGTILQTDTGCASAFQPFPSASSTGLPTHCASAARATSSTALPASSTIHRQKLASFGRYPGRTGSLGRPAVSSLVAAFSRPFRSPVLQHASQTTAVAQKPGEAVTTLVAVPPAVEVRPDPAELTLPPCETYAFTSSGTLLDLFHAFHDRLGKNAPECNGKWFAMQYRLLVRSLRARGRLDTNDPSTLLERAVRRCRMEQEGKRSPLRAFLEDGCYPVSGVNMEVVRLNPLEVSDGWYCVECVADNKLRPYLQVGQRIRVLDPTRLLDPVSPLDADGPALGINYNACSIEPDGPLGRCKGHPGSLRSSDVEPSSGTVSLMDITCVRFLPNPNDDQTSLLCVDTSMTCPEKEAFFFVVVLPHVQISVGTRLLISKVRPVRVNSGELRIYSTKFTRIRSFPSARMWRPPLFPSNIARSGNWSFTQPVRPGSFVDLCGVVLHVETLEPQRQGLDLCIYYICCIPEELMCRVIAPRVIAPIGCEVLWESLTFSQCDPKPLGCFFDVFHFNGSTAPESRGPQQDLCKRWRVHLAQLVQLDVQG